MALADSRGGVVWYGCEHFAVWSKRSSIGRPSAEPSRTRPLSWGTARRPATTNSPCEHYVSALPRPWRSIRPLLGFPNVSSSSPSASPLSHVGERERVHADRATATAPLPRTGRHGFVQLLVLESARADHHRFEPGLGSLISRTAAAVSLQRHDPTPTSRVGAAAQYSRAVVVLGTHLPPSASARTTDPAWSVTAPRCRCRRRPWRTRRASGSHAAMVGIVGGPELSSGSDRSRARPSSH